MEQTNPSQPLSDHSSRRQFLAAAGLTAAGVGLAGMLPSTAAANTRRPIAPAAATATTSVDVAASSSLFAVPMDSNGNYTLPPLPYAYNALEPAIDEQTMRLHHDIHFRSYMTGLNNALKALAEARASDDFATISQLQSLLAFHGAGYNLHVVFFQNMAPAGSTRISSNLNSVLRQSFGSVEAMQAQFSTVAGGVQGSGWAILGYQPFGDKLIILQVEKHQDHTQWGVIPILALDVWEHAYYLKYQNRRGDYIKQWWSVVNWENVEQRITAARSLVG